ncbi:uncharacterized protein [Physcomitrium patens]|nr:uncharacterized protein LOC112279170 isoform X3 [Physcomitrium patens]XP_024369118.1 uncharacterized protein LOC112279170 isoform X3 [Physcomitrium patens]|eukprot:XP_024369117.1 uncharacterized protein LOC112279170 isoform X3 [Physcomitrella patens]
MSNFTEMERCATRMLNITSTESQEALQQGLSAVFEKFLSKFIEEDLAPWEAYCREVCFKVPDGMVLPEKLDASVVAMEDADAKLDAELISLRERKATASLLYPTEFLLGIVYVKWMLKKKQPNYAEMLRPWKPLWKRKLILWMPSTSCRIFLLLMIWEMWSVNCGRTLKRQTL